MIDYEDEVTTVIVNHCERQRWDGYIRNFSVNMDNTRVATVITQSEGDDRTRVQQLWDAGTGELFWTHEHTEVNTVTTMFPSFSPEGRYVGFFNGDNHVILLDADSASEIERINVENIDARRIDITRIRAFAIGPNGSCIALGAPLRNKVFGSVYGIDELRTVNGRPVHVVPLWDSEILPHIYYTSDGESLFCMSHSSFSSTRRKIKMFNLSSLQWMGVIRLNNVRWCDVRSPVQMNYLNSREEVSLPVEVLFEKSGGRTPGNLWRGKQEVVKQALAVSVKQSKECHMLEDSERMVIWNGKIFFVNCSLGTISTWQAHSLIRVVARFTPLRSGQIEWNKVVAFNGIILTLIDWNEAKFRFVHVRPLD